MHSCQMIYAKANGFLNNIQQVIKACHYSYSDRQFTIDKQKQRE